VPLSVKPKKRFTNETGGFTNGRGIAAWKPEDFDVGGHLSGHRGVRRFFRFSRRETFSWHFISGYGFAASHYGLPDIGFISWTDIVDLVHRIRTVLPEHYLLVDIDDGYADVEVACHVVSLLESVGASGVVLEDQ
jgi:hypothetical protein